MLVSSPRTWGCFLGVCCSMYCRMVFPTHVGVFPFSGFTTLDTEGLPHARGGVSAPVRRANNGNASSPRTWGCFCQPNDWSQSWRVFPTHVGVFLLADQAVKVPAGLPHARGGVSTVRCTTVRCTTSSPRTWGCFPKSWQVSGSHSVFPTHVGVFPRIVASTSISRSLPHARGGVSCEGSTSIGVLESSLHMWDLAISGILVLE
ncbi:Domain of uncharacterised function (DUF2825) [Klebsiella pneumoniae]|nr:Domain of uncharacterised function (DUF2825) [Klebsiella pneumoniae]